VSALVAPRALAEVALIAALTAAGAFIRLPLPYVPITLQGAFVCLAGIWLGPARGATSQLVYLLTGLLGFPIFARGGGPHYVLEPSFGYLLGFPLAALAIGLLTRGSPSYLRCLLAIAAGLALIYLPGVSYLYLNLHYVVGREIHPGTACRLGLAPLPKDLLLAPLIALVAFQVRRRRAALPSLRTRSGT
jgi:biotin transport system substrate-specific component